MYKMVVSDFFGALINKEEAISLSTMLELDKMRKKGVLFCITTDHSARIVNDYNKDFPFIDYIVAFNGSYVYDVNKKKVIYNKRLSVVELKRIYKLFSKKDMCFYTLNHCNYTGRYRDNYYSEMIIDIDSFIEEKKTAIYKIKVFFEEKEEANEAYKFLKGNPKINCYLREENKTFVIEIYNSVNSKLLGVEKILTKKKFSLQDVLVVCVASSSFSLAKQAGCSYVMANGDKELRKVIKNVTGSNEEKGVEQVLKKYY